MKWNLFYGKKKNNIRTYSYLETYNLALFFNEIVTASNLDTDVFSSAFYKNDCYYIEKF